MTPTARLACAIDLLTTVLAAPRRPADGVANEFFRARRYIGSGDRRAVADRAWRVIRARRRLGWWLDRAAGDSTPHMLAAASLALEGWTWDGIASSFAGGRFGATPLTKAEAGVIQTLIDQLLDTPEMPDAVRIEVPDWLLPHVVARFGTAMFAEMAALSDVAPLDLRVNILKTTRAEAQAALQAEGLDVEPTQLSPWGLRIPSRRAVTSGAAFQTGLVEIQDEGSQLVAMLVDAAPDARVADWCAGAGGKTLAIAAAMGNRGHIAACDVSAKRLEGAVRRLRRAGVHNVERHLVTAGDKWVKRRAGSFDRVLVDAPCTGTGTWRRNPDARLRLREIDLTELVPKQADILDTAARLVRPGGRLIYATCSIIEAENAQQVARFIDRHPQFEIVDASGIGGVPGPGPFLQLTPLQHGTDGFFGAVLQRRSGSDVEDAPTTMA